MQFLWWRKVPGENNFNGLSEVLKREVLVVNLDPAVEDYKYDCVIDIWDLVTVVEVMD